jgi:hypothetical protein
MKIIKKRGRRTKGTIQTHAINCKVSDEQFEQFKEIRRLSGKSISALIRENIPFLLSYYGNK